MQTIERRNLTMTNIPQGWQCLVCGRVYSPGTPECTRCNSKSEHIGHRPPDGKIQIFTLNKSLPRKYGTKTDEW